jgi:hypothetical protein
VNELLDDDASVLAEEDDGVGCPLPSTPEDEHLLDCEVRMYYRHRNSCYSVTMSLTVLTCGVTE